MRCMIRHTGCSVVELRRYTLRPGARETLIDLFDGELVEPQEAVGAHVIGQFRDVDDPDAFVWLRGFRDMEARRRALSAFYGGPVWARHRDAANATMIDSDDVRLLRPVHDGDGLVAGGDRPGPGAGAAGRRLLVMVVLPLRPEAAPGFPSFFERSVAPHLRTAGATVATTLRTEHAPNDYPALPVRKGEELFVWLSSFDDMAAHARHQAALERSAAWRQGVSPALAQRLDGPPETFRLAPTARSLLPR